MHESMAVHALYHVTSKCMLSCRHVQAVPEHQQPGSMLAAAMLAAAMFTSQVQPVAAADVTEPSASSAAVPTVYFGNGCFWVSGC